MSKNIITVTDTSFDADVIDHPGLVLVDFWAPWCGPCKMLAPILADIANEYAGQARIAKMNADENPRIPGAFSIRGLPSILVFVDGEERARLLGTVSKTRLALAIEQHLPS